MEVPLPLGDVLDRITILRIKRRRMHNPRALEHVRRELAELEDRWTEAGFQAEDEERALEQVNEALWDIEDALRRHEAAGDFGPSFVELARGVYHQNDRRAALKRAVNEKLGSRFIEQKEYVRYGA